MKDEEYNKKDNNNDTLTYTIKKKLMETTTTTFYSDITEKIKENAPSMDKIKEIAIDNKGILSVAGGAFLMVLGLKFLSKTVGFLAFTGGAVMLYKAAMQSEPVKEVLNKIAENGNVKG